MADLIFTIKTPAELKGVQDAITAFEQAKGKAMAAGKAVAEFDAKIARAQASIDAYNASQARATPGTQKLADESERYQAALEKMAGAAHEQRAVEAQRLIDLRNTTSAQTQETGATQDAARATGRLTLRKEELKQAISAVAREFPLLGLAGRVALNPVVGAVIGFTYIVNKSREDYAKFRAELEKKANLEGLKGPITAVKDAIVGAREETEKFFGALNKAATPNTSLATFASDTITALENQADKLRELDEAYKDHALAQLRYQKATGEITPEQFESKVLDVENEFARRNQKRQADADATRQAVLREKLAAAEAARKEIAPQVAPAIAAAAQAATEAQRIVANKATARKNLQAQNELIAGTKDQTGLQDLRDQLGISPDDADALARFRSVAEFDTAAQREQLPRRRGVDARKWVEANLALGAAREKQSGLAAKLRELDAAEAPSARRAEQLREQADALKSKLEQIESDARTLTDRLHQVEGESRQNTPIRTEIERVRRATRGVQTDTQIFEERARQEKESRGGAAVPLSASPSVPPRMPSIPVLPDAAGAFAAYHAQNLAVITELVATVDASQQELADLGSRSRDLRNT